jgi:hypothetical protein
MARYDKDNDSTLPSPNNSKHIDKPKGQMSIREAAAMEMPNQGIETGMPGTAVHGFGEGQVDTPKRHTGTPMTGMMVQGPPPSERTEMPMQGAMQRNVGESVTTLVHQVFELPFHAQLGMLRMIAPRILASMDARDQELFMTHLRSEIGTVGTETPTDSPSLDTQNLQGT